MTNLINRSLWLRRITQALAVILGIALMTGLCLRAFPEGSAQRLASPDGRVIAYVVHDTSSTAMDAEASWIELRTRFTPFRHTVFGGLNYGATLTASWIDSRSLLIRCTTCSKLDVRGKEIEWRGISIHYAIE